MNNQYHIQSHIMRAALCSDLTTYLRKKTIKQLAAMLKKIDIRMHRDCLKGQYIEELVAYLIHNSELDTN
jgi:hypothetical protein